MGEPSTVLSTNGTLLIGGIGALFVMANHLLPTLSPAVQPWGQVAVVMLQ